MLNVVAVIKNDYDSYIMMLRRLWLDIENDTLLSFIIKKEDLARGYADNIYPKILFALN